MQFSDQLKKSLEKPLKFLMKAHQKNLITLSLLKFHKDPQLFLDNFGFYLIFKIFFFNLISNISPIFMYPKDKIK